MTPLQLHTYQTPNGHKASIMLEETRLPYEARLVDIERGDQRSPAFLALNPNNKIPVIVDPDAGRTVWESGAILFYLADRAGVLRTASEDERTAVLQWVLFQGFCCKVQFSAHFATIRFRELNALYIAYPVQKQTLQQNPRRPGEPG